MELLHQFVNSLNVEQVATVFGIFAYLVHTALNWADKNNRLTEEFNKFLRNALVVIVPVAATLTQVVNDPNFQAFFTTYFPSLAFFVTGYQGVYWFVQAVRNFLERAKSLLAPVELEPGTTQF